MRQADYYTCSECGEECEVVDISDDTGIARDERSDCCGAIPQYHMPPDNDDWFEIDRNWGLDITDVDY